MEDLRRLTFLINTWRLNFCSVCMYFSSLGVKVRMAARIWKAKNKFRNRNNYDWGVSTLLYLYDVQRTQDKVNVNSLLVLYSLSKKYVKYDLNYGLNIQIMGIMFRLGFWSFLQNTTFIWFHISFFYSVYMAKVSFFNTYWIPFNRTL